MVENVKKIVFIYFLDKVKKWVWLVKGNIVGIFSKLELGNKGIDIVGVKGSDIFVVVVGKVVYLGNVLCGYGNLVIIKYIDIFLSVYVYNDIILVKEREWVYVG